MATTREIADASRQAPPAGAPTPTVVPRPVLEDVVFWLDSDDDEVSPKLAEAARKRDERHC